MSPSTSKRIALATYQRIRAGVKNLELGACPDLHGEFSPHAGHFTMIGVMEAPHIGQIGDDRISIARL
jgi:hypothetical protein